MTHDSHGRAPAREVREARTAVGGRLDPGRRRRAAVLLAGGLAVPAILAGCAPGTVDTDTTESVAVVEDFFARLEAGRASDAAALTTVDLDEDLVDDDFYRASVARPTDARVVASSGSSVGASVTVEFTLDGVDGPVSLEVRTTRDGDRTMISDLGTADTVGAGQPVPGTLTVNGQVEYPAAELTPVTLLPGAYAVEYTDPNGLLEGLGRGSSFTAYVPDVVREDGVVAEGFAFAPTLMPDVEPGVEEAVERLQAACEDEGLTGPSCPSELVENARETSRTEWFAEPGPVIRYVDGAYEATAEYTVLLWDDGDLPAEVRASYAGTVSRDASGKIAFTRL
ncbi:hypothetical protein G8C93_13755 [Cellulosimicrobium cellulans]|uniref:hypothetical protein n=1 Tax=Cellulosimicrobium cellulans TaxID=1710 RepID=UPI001883F569|nr:hypothetical protein [Cellulosimicrobium cellulans]MBE9926952.1 hypothetical protein [Cellulosimicrobium cellulans]